MGETVALPQVLDVGLHYEYLHSADFYEGATKVDDPADTRVTWNRLTLTASYGILTRLGVTVVAPVIWKEKSLFILGINDRLDYQTDGVGDISAIFRFSLIPRSFVNYRELSIGIGIKMPTGSVERKCCGFELPKELQPGTGSWDFSGSISYYQGFEVIDFIIGGTIEIPSEHENYRFGNQLSYTAIATYHLCKRLDLSFSTIGLIRGKDELNNVELESTGRRQFWISPGIQLVVIPEKLRFQAYFEHPIYQYFNGRQLGGDYNFRLTLTSSFPLAESEEE